MSGQLRFWQPLALLAFLFLVRAAQLEAGARARWLSAVRLAEVYRGTLRETCDYALERGDFSNGVEAPGSGADEGRTKACMFFSAACPPAEPLFEAEASVGCFCLSDEERQQVLVAVTERARFLSGFVSDQVRGPAQASKRALDKLLASSVVALPMRGSIAERLLALWGRP